MTVIPRTPEAGSKGAPEPGSIAVGELVIDPDTGALYTKLSSGVVAEVAASPRLSKEHQALQLGVSELADSSEPRHQLGKTGWIALGTSGSAIAVGGEGAILSSVREDNFGSLTVLGREYDENGGMSAADIALHSIGSGSALRLSSGSDHRELRVEKYGAGDGASRFASAQDSDCVVVFDAPLSGVCNLTIGAIDPSPGFGQSGDKAGLTVRADTTSLTSVDTIVHGDLTVEGTVVDYPKSKTGLHDPSVTLANETAIANIVRLSQADYTALSNAGHVSATTLYIIT